MKIESQQHADICIFDQNILLRPLREQLREAVQLLARLNTRSKHEMQLLQWYQQCVALNQVSAVRFPAGCLQHVRPVRRERRKALDPRRSATS